MRAWRLHDTDGPTSYRLEEAPDPPPGPGEVRISLEVSALNHLDLWVSRGLPRPRHLPHIAGADGAGIIDQVGEGVHREPGEEVIVNPSISCGSCPTCLAGEVVLCSSFAILGEHLPGTLADRVVVPSRNAIPKPPELDWETAGSFALASGTAHRMLRRADLRAGQVLLVVGVGGGVSSTAALLGIAAGARVFVTSRSPGKIRWALEQGAEAGFDSSGEFSREVRQVAGGADVVVENVGAATWDQSLRSLRPGGRMVVCGATGGTKVELSLPVLFFKQLEILGSTMFTHRELAEALDLVRTGALRPPIDRVFAFEELPEALARLDSGAQLGKVALRH